MILLTKNPRLLGHSVEKTFAAVMNFILKEVGL